MRGAMDRFLRLLRDGEEALLIEELTSGSAWNHMDSLFDNDPRLPQLRGRLGATPTSSLSWRRSSFGLAWPRRTSRCNRWQSLPPPTWRYAGFGNLSSLRATFASAAATRSMSRTLARLAR